MVVTVTHEGYIKRMPLVELPRAAPRRQGPRRHGDAGGGFRHPPVRRHHPSPVLFFSSRGMAYKLKVWRLPVAAPQARGKAMVNLLPLAEGERITTILPLPEDEGSWDKLDVMFATSRRRRAAQQALRFRPGQTATARSP